VYSWGVRSLEIKEDEGIELEKSLLKEEASNERMNLRKIVMGANFTGVAFPGYILARFKKGMTSVGGKWTESAGETDT